MVNSGLCRVEMPSLRKLRLISNTFSKPPTTRRFRYSSGAMRRNRSHVQRVVVRDEGLGRGAAGDRMHHRRFDFEVAVRDHELADRLDRSACAR